MLSFARTLYQKKSELLRGRPVRRDATEAPVRSLPRPSPPPSSSSPFPSALWQCSPDPHGQEQLRWRICVLACRTRPTTTWLLKVRTASVSRLVTLV